MSQITRCLLVSDSYDKNLYYSPFQRKRFMQSYSKSYRWFLMYAVFGQKIYWDVHSPLISRSVVDCFSCLSLSFPDILSFVLEANFGDKIL